MPVKINDIAGISCWNANGNTLYVAWIDIYAFNPTLGRS